MKKATTDDVMAYSSCLHKKEDVIQLDEGKRRRQSSRQMALHRDLQTSAKKRNCQRKIALKAQF